MRFYSGIRPFGKPSRLFTTSVHVLFLLSSWITHPTQRKDPSQRSSRFLCTSDWILPPNPLIILRSVNRVSMNLLTLELYVPRVNLSRSMLGRCSRSMIGRLRLRNWIDVPVEAKAFSEREWIFRAIHCAESGSHSSRPSMTQTNLRSSGDPNASSIISQKASRDARLRWARWSAFSSPPTHCDATRTRFGRYLMI